MKKIKKIDIYQYPVDLKEEAFLTEKGLVIEREPFKHAIINKINEIIEILNEGL